MSRFASEAIERLQTTRIPTPRPLWKPGPPLSRQLARRWSPAPFEVASTRRDTTDTWTLELVPRRQDPVAFAPGQFSMIAASGSGEVPISISGDPDGERGLMHTVRAVGLATEAICAARPGDVLGVRAPFGRPWPVAELEGRDVVVVAGGIGLAPLRSAILRMLARRERYGRLTLLYGGRQPENRRAQRREADAAGDDDDISSFDLGDRPGSPERGADAEDVARAGRADRLGRQADRADRVHERTLAVGIAADRDRHLARAARGDHRELPRREGDRVFPARNELERPGVGRVPTRGRDLERRRRHRRARSGRLSGTGFHRGRGVGVGVVCKRPIASLAKRDIRR